MEEKTYRSGFIKEGVSDVFLLSCLVSPHDRLSCCIIHDDPSALREVESTPLDLPEIDERQDQSISYRRPKLFDQIQSKTGSARTLGMQETDLGVESDGFQG